MLVDIDLDTINQPHQLSPVLDAVAGFEGTKVERIDTGLYEIKHFNFDFALTAAGIKHDMYPFESWWKKPNRTEEELKARMAELRAWALSDRPGDYGVCDYPCQLIEKYPIIETDPRKFVCSFTPIRKSDQPPRDGWRWHKWGTYIGGQDPQYEYLYHEKDITQVWVYHIYEVF